MADAKQLDVVTVGRSSVDLYGEQVGGRLEDMASFAKYVGGCPTNIAVGTARLGLRSALITRVGDEHMGRFIKEQCEREGVDVRGIVTDPQRLTALVILGIRDKDTFPLIFYRENCADAALGEADIDEDLIASAKAVVVTGTHFSTASLDAASRKAMRLARAHGGRVVLDIDYRPVLWGLTGHGLGEERFVANDGVSAHLQTILPECDLIVGTEEEIHIAGGSTDTMAAIRAVRAAAPEALIVVKRGPMGCTAFPGPIPATIDEGVSGPGFPVEVFNVLGAGDAFMSGFLRGWLRDLPLDGMLPAGQRLRRVRRLAPWLRPGDPVLERARGLSAHRQRASPAARGRQARAGALGHQPQPALAAGAGLRLRPPRPVRGDVRPRRHQPRAHPLLQAAGAERGDDDRGRPQRRRHPARRPLRPGRAGPRHRQGPVDRPAGRAAGLAPLALRGRAGPGLHLARTGRPSTASSASSSTIPTTRRSCAAEQERQVLVLADACRRNGHDLLLEVIPGKSDAPVDDTHARPRHGPLLRAGRLSRTGGSCRIRAAMPAWAAIADEIAANDPHCRGVLLLGLEAPEAELMAAFAMARRHPVCKGFAVGRTIFAQAGRGLARRPDQRPAGDPGHGGRLSPPDRRLGEGGMSELLLRHQAPDAAGLVHRVTPESAGWSLCRLRAVAAAARPEPGAGDRRARGLPRHRRRQGRHRGRRAILVRPRRSRRPVRGQEPVLGLRPLARAVPGDGRDRARARDLLGARRRQPSGAADPAPRPWRPAAAARAPTSAMCGTSCRRASPPIRCSWSR